MMAEPEGELSAPTQDTLLPPDLVMRACAGDVVAFEDLFHTYTAPITTYLARMVENNEEGRDLTQETFIRAWRMLASLHDPARFSAWLYRIATNVALDHLRSRKLLWIPWGNLSRHSEATTLQIVGPETSVTEGELIKLVLRRLSPKYRACLLLHIEAGFSQREIAALLHIQEKSVSVYIKRGCEQFRQTYQRLVNE